MQGHQGLVLILVRHTQTADNVDRIYTGQRDISLNAEGIRQAMKLARTLAERKVCALYVSDLSRTMQVGNLIKAGHEGVPLQPDRRLRELDMGQLAGLTKDHVSVHYPEAHFKTSGAYDFTSVGGETRREVITRQLSLLREARDAHFGSSGAIVFVGHGTALQSLLDALGTGLKLHPQGEYTELAFSDFTLPDESSY
jgi:broad specificity phosphatase PhoE